MWDVSTFGIMCMCVDVEIYSHVFPRIFRICVIPIPSKLSGVHGTSFASPTEAVRPTRRIYSLVSTKILKRNFLVFPPCKEAGKCTHSMSVCGRLAVKDTQESLRRPATPYTGCMLIF